MPLGWKVIDPKAKGVYEMLYATSLSSEVFCGAPSDQQLGDCLQPSEVC